MPLTGWCRRRGEHGDGLSGCDRWTVGEVKCACGVRVDVGLVKPAHGHVVARMVCWVGWSHLHVCEVEGGGGEVEVRVEGEDGATGEEVAAHPRVLHTQRQGEGVTAGGTRRSLRLLDPAEWMCRRDQRTEDMGYCAAIKQSSNQAEGSAHRGHEVRGGLVQQALHKELGAHCHTGDR